MNTDIVTDKQKSTTTYYAVIRYTKFVVPFVVVTDLLQQIIFTTQKYSIEKSHF